MKVTPLSQLAWELGEFDVKLGSTDYTMWGAVATAGLDTDGESEVFLSCSVTLIACTTSCSFCHKENKWTSSAKSIDSVWNSVTFFLWQLMSSIMAGKDRAPNSWKESSASNNITLCWYNWILCTHLFRFLWGHHSPLISLRLFPSLQFVQPLKGQVWHLIGHHTVVTGLHAVI